MKMKNLVKMTIIFLVIFSIAQKGYSQIVPTNGYVYVKADGTGNGSSWATATSDLQGAIDADGVNKVWIAEGTYYPTWQWDLSDPRAFSFKMKNGVSIFGGFPNTGDPTLSDMNPLTNIVILSGDLGVLADYSDNAYHVIYNMADLALNQNAYISGVNIKFGNANGLVGDNNRGGGVFNDNCSPTFYNCKISHNYGIRGAGMYNWESSPNLSTTDFIYNEAEETGGGILNSSNSSPILNSCYIISNTAVVYGAGIANVDNCHPILTQCFISANESDGSAGGILNSENSNPHIESCKIINNKAAQYGGGILNNQSKPLIVNCIISNNEASLAGGGILNSENSTPSIINNTIVQNIAGVFGSSIANDNSSPNITNCIIWDNNSDMYNQGTSNPQVTYSCVENSYFGTGNISDDPLFTSNSISDFYLQFNSPAINAGINDSVPIGVIEDANFNDRILNGVVDMGAYELSGIIYVKQSAFGNDDGTSWYNAYASLESALDAASEGCEIWIAAGTYKPTNNHGTGGTERFNHFRLINGVKIYGGFIGTETNINQRNWQTNPTILSGNLPGGKTFNLMYASNLIDETTIIDGLRFQEANANGSNAQTRSGSLLYCLGSPTVRNCRFNGGLSALDGGNIYLNNSSSEFYNCEFTSGSSDGQGGSIAIVNSQGNIFNKCTFYDNYSYPSGGAVAILSSTEQPKFISCAFIENNANDDGSGGAMIINPSASALIINSYFSDNYCAREGGALAVFGNADLINNTFYYNSCNSISLAKGGNIYLHDNATALMQNTVVVGGYAVQGPEIYIKPGGQLNTSFCIIENCGGSGTNWDTDLGNDLGNNIDDGDYYWENYSEAIQNNWLGIDQGTQEPYTSGGIAEDILTDFAGYPRFRAYNIDIGHIEIPYISLTVFFTPSEVVDHAEWTLDNWINFNYHGHSYWKTPEIVTIEFSDVEGYVTPAPVIVDMEWGQDYDIYGNYILSTDLNKEKQNPNFTVYPNPVENTLHFEFATTIENQLINIYATDGKLLKSIKSDSSNQIDVSDLRAGLYFIKYLNQTIKLIKN